MNVPARRRLFIIGFVTLALVAALVFISMPGPAPQPTPTSSPDASRTASSAPTSTPLVPGPTPLAGAKVDLPACPETLDVAPGPAPAIESPINGPVTLELVGRLGGSSPGIALDGTRLLMGQGDRVAAFDVADRARPMPSGTSDALPGTVSALAASDGVVVAGLGTAGVAVLEPGDLTLLGTLALPGWVESVAIEGALAFVADGPGGLRVVDISTPAAPRELGAALDLHRVMDVVVAGSTAYLAAADEGLVMVDVSDPAAPSPVGGLVTGGYAYGLDVESDAAYLADAWGGLAAVDVSIPAAPRLLAIVPSPAWITAVDVVGTRAFAAAGSDGLLALDVAQTGSPFVIGSLPMPSTGAVGLISAGTTAIVATGSQGAAIVDVADPEQPAVVGSVSPFGSAQGVALVGERAYLAARDQGLRILDIADPAEPREIGHVSTRDEVTAVTAVGPTVFFWTIPTPDSGASHSIFGLLVADPDVVAPETPYHVGVTVGATTAGSLVLVGNESGLQLIDGSSATPCELGFIQTLQEGRALAGGVAARGDVAYVAVGDTGLYVVDIADPRHPTRIGSAPLPPRGKSTNAVLAAGSTLYTLSNGHDGEIVAAYDVARPRTPRLLGTLTLPDPSLALGEDGVQPLAYADGRLFVAEGAGGLVVLDVSRPARMAVAGRIGLGGKAASVVVRGGLAYVAVQGQGLSIVRWMAGVATGSLDARQGLGSPAQLARSGPGVRAVLSMQDGSAECVVKTTRDSGPGTLRECLDLASPGLEITFDPGTFPRRNPATIRLRSPLPQLEGVSIDASRAGVILDGGHDVEEGLRLGSTSEVRGLTITAFVAAGVYMDGSGNLIADNVVGGNEQTGIVMFGSDNRVVGNLVGPDPTRRRGWKPQEIGVAIHDMSSVVGGSTDRDRNVIAGNFLEVHLKQAHGNTLEGNYIGIDQTGTRLLRPTAARAQFGAIGSDFNASGNLIRGNVVGGGISISGADLGTSYNQIVGNLIGVDASGLRALPCECHGIGVSSPYTRIGGIRPGEGNVVNGGIVVGGHDVIVLGNSLGTDVEGRSLGAPGGGPLSLDSARRDVAGGAAAGAGNRVVGPLGVRLADGAASNLIIGNTLLPRAFFEEDEAVGVLVVASAGNLLVGNRVESGKVGIVLEQGADGNVLRGNTLAKNDLGVRAASRGNVIVLNTFSRNRRPAIDQGASNRWDDGAIGNYWSDRTAPDENHDGIVDTPRDVPPNGRDRFPLAAPP